MVVTTGAISHAKLQSNHHHQQTNIQFFYRPDVLPVAQPTVSNSEGICKGSQCVLSSVLAKVICAVFYVSFIALRPCFKLTFFTLILKIHQNTTIYSKIVDVSVSIRDLHQMKKLVLASI